MYVYCPIFYYISIMQTSQIIKRSKEIKMEKPKAEVEQMTYEEYCTYLLKLENEDNNREYEDPIDECYSLSRL